MNEREENTRHFELVSMYEAEVSTEDRPIIGTDALATCVGVLIYNENKKQAIVAHVAPEQYEILYKILDLLIQNDWLSDNIKYLVIPGYYEEHYNTKEYLEDALSSFEKMLDYKKINNGIKINEKYTCHYFAFDSRTGNFITDKVYFGEEYYKINTNRKR